jgi:RNA polymerase sigma factor (TIGR02999 family)
MQSISQSAGSTHGREDSSRGPSESKTITRLLEAWSDGETDALGDLLPQVIQELKQLARGQLSHERPGHTLQPTALVHEIYLQLVRQRRVHWANRKQFFAFAGTLMRRVLVSHARKRQAAKRGGEASCVTLDERRLAEPLDWQPIDLVALDRALDRLAERSPRQAQVIEMRFFAGLTVAETAEALDVSPATVKLDWSVARAWLFRELTRRSDAAHTEELAEAS